MVWRTDIILLLLLLGLVVTYLFMARGPARVRGAGAGANGSPPGGASRRRGWTQWYALLIRQAGLQPGALALSYWASKVFLAALFPLLLMQYGLGVYQLLDAPTLLAALIGFLVPDLWLLRVRQVRRRRIRSALSFFLDLVVALLHSGLPLERAFLRAAREGFSEPHPLAEEAQLIGREMDMGKDRSAAFKALADRTGVYELRAVSAALGMGLRRGVAIDDALEAQADMIRSRHRERAIRRVHRAAVVAALPILLCGVPVFAVVVYFPGFVTILEALRSLRAF